MHSSHCVIDDGSAASDRHRLAISRDWGQSESAQAAQSGSPLIQTCILRLRQGGRPEWRSGTSEERTNGLGWWLGSSSTKSITDHCGSSFGSRMESDHSSRRWPMQDRRINRWPRASGQDRSLKKAREGRELVDRALGDKQHFPIALAPFAQCVCAKTSESSPEPSDQLNLIRRRLMAVTLDEPPSKTLSDRTAISSLKSHEPHKGSVQEEPNKRQFPGLPPLCLHSGPRNILPLT